MSDGHAPWRGEGHAGEPEPQQEQEPVLVRRLHPGGPRGQGRHPEQQQPAR